MVNLRYRRICAAVTALLMPSAVDVGGCRIVAANRRGLTFATKTLADTCVLTGFGVLDDTTCFAARDAVIKATINEPRAVIVDVTRLVVADQSAWSVFISARSHIAHWPDTPMALVCDDIRGQRVLRCNDANRHIPVYWSVEAALAALPAVTTHTRAGGAPNRPPRKGFPPTR